jgi:hypothetical protein
MLHCAAEYVLEHGRPVEFQAWGFCARSWWSVTERSEPNQANGLFRGRPETLLKIWLGV